MKIITFYVQHVKIELSHLNNKKKTYAFSRLLTKLFRIFLLKNIEKENFFLLTLYFLKFYFFSELFLFYVAFFPGVMGVVPENRIIVGDYLMAPATSSS